MKAKVSTSLILVLCCSLKARADTIVGSVRRISSQQATGQSGQLVLIELAPGAGVNISFIPTGETVEKVWLDNPAIATLDADGCLSSLAGAEQPSVRQCDTSAPVSVLHLRQINPLIIPGLPKSRTALLTAITNGPHGRRIYLFRVTTGKSSSYNTVEVIPLLPAVTSTNTLEPQQQARSVKADWLSWQRGLQVAEQQGWIRQGQPLWQRIQNFFTRVQAGEPIESAASASGISLLLVRRLYELGQMPLETNSNSWDSLNRFNHNP